MATFLDPLPTPKSYSSSSMNVRLIPPTNAQRARISIIDLPSTSHDPNRLDNKRCNAGFNYYEYERQKFTPPSESQILVV